MPRSDLVQSVLRSLDILSLIAQSPEGLPLNAVAAATGLKSPTAHKLVRTLASRGFVEKRRRPVRYALGRAALEMAAGHWNGALLQRATSALRDLSARFPAATFTFCKPVGGEVMNLLRMSPERPGFVERPVDRVMSAYTSASCLVFQAFWTEEERAAYRERHPFWERGAHVWGDIERLDAFLDAVRRLGCAVPDFVKRGVHPVAAPVYEQTGLLRATLGASLPAARADEETKDRLHGAVVAASKELSSGA